MKNIFYFLTCLFAISCSNVKSTFSNDKLNMEDKIIQYKIKKAKAEESNKSILFLTSGFENDTIQIINGKEVLVNEPLETIAQLSLTTVQTVNNEEEVKINILSKKPTRISLNTGKLKTHKFIYIKRDIFNRKKYLVEYTNQSRNFL